MRAGELLGRTAYDLHGRRLGRVVDVVVRGGWPPERFLITDVIVAGHWWTRVTSRLIGPELHPAGPWLLRAAARLIGRSTHQVPVDAVQLHPRVPGFPFDPPAGRR
ncbi:PRC-barrel domain containing protein [Micromonospora sp. PLK6-60]|uniref:PRC-barrel domain containing protein n=1 Tax=Micromonospora sp. PLK6-60 TaxID=2873383 RepID=UPI001CA79501|nr:PRC-barrel domain containing protein [Micromonospora sp. PLK6-60]MBY8875225.1 PRC-barrel domain containing protein [Micromonospora sp. PLK6-60]